VRRALAERSIRYVARERTAPGPVAGFDLVLTVGGDGTFLTASHFVRSTPVLGVVSSAASVGHFCAAKAQGVGQALDALVCGRLRPIELWRLEVKIGARRARELVLNEILFCHANPAATSRYILRVGAAREEQKSSGVWISTAAGSTGAIGSAGGRTLRPTSRRIQYLVREPFLPAHHGYRLLLGMVEDTAIEIASKMEDSSVYIDGPRIRYPVRFGERVTVKRSGLPLVVYGMSLSSSKTSINFS
jgi:NAD+ kinase